VISDFDALFDSFTHSAYRLEALPSYAVSREDAFMRSFLEGTARPERSVRTSPWMRRIAVTTAAGKVWTRTRVHDIPLTEYQRFQLLAYVEALAVGDRTSLVARSAVGNLGPDFWLFDAETDHPFAAVMHYTDDGEFEGFEHVAGATRISMLTSVRRRVEAHEVPLLEFLASHRAVTHG
jgi:hypothetical protein